MKIRTIIKYFVLLSFLYILSGNISTFAGGSNGSTQLVTYSDLTISPRQEASDNSRITIEEKKSVTNKTSLIKPGSIFPLYDALSLAGIILVVFQFIESAKLRNYIFRYSLRAFSIFLILIAIVILVAGYIIYCYFPSCFLITDPSIYEVISLLIFTLFTLFYLIFLLKPKWFLPRFNENFLKYLSLEFMKDVENEHLYAISVLIYEYLEKIIKTATLGNPRFIEDKVDKQNTLITSSREFIDVTMSNSKLIKYVTENNLRYIVKLIKLAEKYSLWDYGGHILFNNLCEALFTQKDSLLSKELSLGGVEGVYRPTSSLLFKSPGIISHYRIFQSFKCWTSDTSQITLNNWVKGLEISLKDYFTQGQNIILSNTPNVALYVTIVDLSECFDTFIYEIYKQKDNIWKNIYRKKMSTILRFFSNLENILIQTDIKSDYQPNFTEEELKVGKDTVTSGISRAIFNILASISLIENETYARNQAMDLYFILYGHTNAEILLRIQSNLLEMIKERVEENKKGHYSSMIKLLINIYGHGFFNKDKSSGIIGKYIENEFYTNLGKLYIENAEFRKNNLLKKWTIDANSKSIIDSNNKTIFEYNKSYKVV